MKGNYFEVQINASSHIFTLECSTMYETMDALVDAATSFKFDINKDRIMSTLVDMKNGNTTSYSSHTWAIYYKKSEE